MDVNSINVTSAANATPEVIAAWKKAHPKGIFELVVPSDEFDMVPQDSGRPIKVFRPKFKCWVRQPTRNELRELSSKPMDKITYNEAALEAIWLGGDIECKNDDEAFLSISGVIADVLDVREAEIKKL